MNNQYHFLKDKILLYAEDELQTQQQYQCFFENYFKTVLTADDGQQALDVYVDKKPDVLVLDINMPKISGLDVCKEIRKSDKETQIILLTSHTDKQLLFAAVEMGLTCYLEKPIGRKALKEALLKLENRQPRIQDIPLWGINQKNYKWDCYKKTLYCNKQSIYLTKKETDLFQLFISHAGKTLSYREMYQGIEDKRMKKKYSENAIKTLLKELRSKLPPDAINNVYGQGYILEKRQ